MKKSQNSLIIKEDHRQLIDEYYINGFSQINAAKVVWPDMTEATQRTWASLVLKNPKYKDYIRSKQVETAEAAKITPAEIARELKNVAFADVTAFVGLTESEIKALPAEQRRSLSKVTIKNKRTRLKDGTEFDETTYSYQLKDTLGALRDLAKHIGFFELDNRQKASHTNVLNILAKSSPETLNALEKAMKTIEIKDQ